MTSDYKTTHTQNGTYLQSDYMIHHIPIRRRPIVLQYADGEKVEALMTGQVKNIVEYDGKHFILSGIDPVIYIQEDDDE